MKMLLSLPLRRFQVIYSQSGRGQNCHPPQRRTDHRQASGLQASKQQRKQIVSVDDDSCDHLSPPPRGDGGGGGGGGGAEVCTVFDWLLRCVYLFMIGRFLL